MELERAKSAVSAASAALIALGCCVLAFLPPLLERVQSSAILMVLLGLAIATSLALHLIFVALAARQLGRSGVLWAILALVTLPLGSIVGLVLFEWATANQAKNAPRSPA